MSLSNSQQLCDCKTLWSLTPKDLNYIDLYQDNLSYALRSTDSAISYIQNYVSSVYSFSSSASTNLDNYSCGNATNFIDIICKHMRESIHFLKTIAEQSKNNLKTEPCAAFPVQISDLNYDLNISSNKLCDIIENMITRISIIRTINANNDSEKTYALCFNTEIIFRSIRIIRSIMERMHTAIENIKECIRTKNCNLGQTDISRTSNHLNELIPLANLQREVNRIGLINIPTAPTQIWYSINLIVRSLIKTIQELFSSISKPIYAQTRYELK